MQSIDTQVNEEDLESKGKKDTISFYYDLAGKYLSRLKYNRHDKVGVIDNHFRGKTILSYNGMILNKKLTFEYYNIPDYARILVLPEMPDDVVNPRYKLYRTISHLQDEERYRFYKDITNKECDRLIDLMHLKSKNNQRCRKIKISSEEREEQMFPTLISPDISEGPAVAPLPVCWSNYDD